MGKKNRKKKSKKSEHVAAGTEFKGFGELKGPELGFKGVGKLKGAERKLFQSVAGRFMEKWVTENHFDIFSDSDPNDWFHFLSPHARVQLVCEVVVGMLVFLLERASLYLSISLFIYLSISLSLSRYLAISLSRYLAISLYLYLSISLSFCVCMCVYVCVCVCICVYMCVSHHSLSVCVKMCLTFSGARRTITVRLHPTSSDVRILDEQIAVGQIVGTAAVIGGLILNQRAG